MSDLNFRTQRYVLIMLMEKISHWDDSIILLVENFKKDLSQKLKRKIFMYIRRKCTQFRMPYIWSKEPSKTRYQTILLHGAPYDWVANFRPTKRSPILWRILWICWVSHQAVSSLYCCRIRFKPPADMITSTTKSTILSIFKG